jgi:hypothetical protein
MGNDASGVKSQQPERPTGCSNALVGLDTNPLAQECLHRSEKTEQLVQQCYQLVNHVGPGQRTKQLPKQSARRVSSNCQYHPIQINDKTKQLQMKRAKYQGEHFTTCLLTRGCRFDGCCEHSRRYRGAEIARFVHAFNGLF